jgi:hypothetical protein
VQCLNGIGTSFELGVEVLEFEKNVLEPKLHGF